LLKLISHGADLLESNEIWDIKEILGHVNKLLKQIASNGYPRFFTKDANPVQSNLTDGFIASIKKVVKPGMK
jgi:hypothetical protein